MSNLVAPPPEACPGPESEVAGKGSACDGCPNQQICSSGQARLPDPDLGKVTERMALVKHKILVLSGKGGVGKSTFTAMFARYLAGDPDAIDDRSDGDDGDDDELTQVGVLDIDVCGPSQPRLLGVAREQVHTSNQGWEPVWAQENLAVMSVGFLLGSPDDAVVWRGPKKNGLIKQFLRDVNWGPVDYLLVDTPPGTSDEHLSIVQYLRQAGVDGAVLVTTPQEVSLQDVRKEINFCRKVGLPILGVVENMAGFVCPSCHQSSEIFAPTTGGAAAMCKNLDLHLLGSIPLDPLLARMCDEGDSELVRSQSPAAQAFRQIAQKVKDLVGKQQK